MVAFVAFLKDAQGDDIDKLGRNNDDDHPTEISRHLYFQRKKSPQCDYVKAMMAME